MNNIEEAIRSGAVLASVKPLKWRQDSPQVCRAKTILGTAATMKSADGYFVWRLGDLASGSEKTKADAEKMLWGTYKARILSVLSPDPALLALIEERDRLKVERDDCAKYLKDGETPRQRMDRDFADNQSLLEMLVKERAAREALEIVLQEAKWGKGWAVEQVDRAAEEATDAQARALTQETENE